jgi:phage tail-like protein
MAGETQSTVWPLPKFYFSVTGLFGSAPASFQEVSGLESETRPIEYRHGNSTPFAPIKMPGLARGGNVILKKGIFVADPSFWTWFNRIGLNTIAPTTVVVNLLNETSAPQMAWTLNNAFPIKVTGTDLKSEGNEVAVESVEVAFETMVISAG